MLRKQRSSLGRNRVEAQKVLPTTPKESPQEVCLASLTGSLGGLTSLSFVFSPLPVAPRIHRGKYEQVKGEDELPYRKLPKT